MNLFAEISRTNKAYCASLGLPSDTYDRPLSEAEVNGTPLSPTEVEIAHLMANGMSRAKAEKWAPINLLHGVSAKPVIKPALPVLTPEQLAEREARTGASIQKFYDDCRQRGAWVGD